MRVGKQGNTPLALFSSFRKGGQKGFIFTWILIFMCVISYAFAAPSPQLQSQKQKLNQLNQQIASTQSDIKEAKQSAAQLTSQLRQAEKNIGDLSKKVTLINKQIDASNQQLAKLQQQQKQLSQQLDNQRADLAAVLVSAYQTHQETYFKLLLNQEDPQKFSRMMNYYQYFSAAKTKLIDQVNTTLAAIQDNQQKIAVNIASLNDLKQQRLTEQQQLKALQQQRQAVLDQLKAQIKTNQQKLAQLLDDKRNLQDLVNKLSQQEFLNTIEFAQLKGRLPWPTRGAITQQYGSKQYSQSIPYQGVFISAPTGNTINSIAPGKVVFADWLKGFGLLIIIDHGKGYMTLYAHCNSLLKNVGDTVLANVPIATTGNSGGLQNSGVLFQIRKSGDPVNPNSWCRGRP